MKTLTHSLEGKVDQAVLWWIEPKVCHYFMNRYLELLSCVTFKVLALVNIFDIAFRIMFKPEATSVDIMSCIRCGAY